MLAPESLNAIGSLSAALVAIVALYFSIRKQSAATLREHVTQIAAQTVSKERQITGEAIAREREHTDVELRAMQQQMRALEMELAKNYVTRHEAQGQIDGVTRRLEDAIDGLRSEIADLNRFLRKHESRT